MIFNNCLKNYLNKQKLENQIEREFNNEELKKGLSFWSQIVNC